ncbi:hypothetical protein IGI04_002824 [Brassica rapa subsp. trilocularis]|uniref:Uncharacterized protein n=1 Tax=Brassica rapa subsp. trilocularis TaxID=1813537 RepID=A0ABQ7NWM3_BRACM|nr:hypothetical protein IGI04_002824 [Brassica rapa subsp. trilocularis]
MTNEELARLERQNRQQPRTTDTNMGDHGNMDDLTAALALIQQQMQNQQQQMQQMQQTIQNQQQAAQEQAAENAAREERDDIAAKMDQLLKGNQSQVFIMEEATPEKNAGDKAFEAEQAGDDQQEVSYVNGQGWQLKNYHPNPNVRNNPQLFWPKQDKQKELEQPPADQADEGNTEPVVETVSPGSEQPSEAVRPIPEAVPPREYIPKVPYPVPAKVTRKDKEEIKCRKMLEDLTVRLPLMDAIQMMPSMRSFMKGLISGKISEESEFMTVSKECSAEYGENGSESKSGGGYQQLGFCLFKASPFTFPFSPPYTDPPLAIFSKQTTKSLILNRFKWFCFSFVWNLEFSLFLQITSPVSTGKRPDNPNQIATNSMARTKQSAKRTRAMCSTPPPQVQQQTSASYPWPREQEGELIDLDSPLLLDFNCEGWDKGTAARYNALLRVDMLPTRFCHAETLADLGIDEDVFETLHAIGIAPLCYTTHELYPDLHTPFSLSSFLL